MKKLFITILLIGTFSTISSLSAQGVVRAYPDSLRLEFPDHHAIVTFEMRNFIKDYSIVQAFPATLQNLLGEAKKALPANYTELPPQRLTFRLRPHNDHSITNTPGGHSFWDTEEHWEITIEDALPKTHLTIQSDAIKELLPPGWEIHIVAARYKITAYATDFASFEALAAEKFDTIVQKITQDPSLKKIGKNGIISKMVVKNHEVVDSTIGFFFPGDFLELNAAGSLGVVRDKLYPEFSLLTSIYFSDRYGTWKQRLQASFDLSCFTSRNSEGSYKSEINSFVSLSYGINFRGGNRERQQWASLGVGYLVRNNGDYFKGNTAKIFIMTDIGSHKLNLIPELYLTDDFKKSVFGMKLRYKLF